MDLTPEITAEPGPTLSALSVGVDEDDGDRVGIHPMSNPDPQDEQSVAEFLDDDSLGADEVDDIGEDLVRADFPPEHQQGIDYPTPGEEPEDPAPVDVPVTGLMASDDDPDEEVADLGDVERRPPAEEAAMHETAPPPLAEEDSYLDD